jgi:hypothetical protein
MAKSGGDRPSPPNRALVAVYWQPYWQPGRRLDPREAFDRIWKRPCETSLLNVKRDVASKSSSSPLPPGIPEFAVDREAITRFFSPPIGKSTFHDLVGKGTIVPVKGVRGFYRLNESLIRLGLKPVSALPETKIRTGEEIMRLALSLIDPVTFPHPPWLLIDEPTAVEMSLAEFLVSIHEPHIAQLSSIGEKLAYGAGTLDAQVLMDAER